MQILSSLRIAEIPNKGRGVVTLKKIAKDTVVEHSPVIVMDAAARQLLDQTTLHDYIFVWGNNEDECCMAQGYVSIYNHAVGSNCEYFMNFDDNTMQIKTVRDIAAGEELTINYNGDWDNEEDVWFAVKE
ncbi:MAG: SET domain-containing protein [Chitinophagaceae bacterium]|jgi:SET domain-containing protein|nr:SET domain-containing protein [Chitinophagaceae bacterium]